MPLRSLVRSFLEYTGTYVVLYVRVAVGDVFVGVSAIGTDANSTTTSDIFWHYFASLR